MGMSLGELKQFQYEILAGGGDFDYDRERKENKESIERRINSSIKRYQDNPDLETLHNMIKFLSNRYIEIYEISEEQINKIKENIPPDFEIEESMDESLYTILKELDVRYTRDVKFLLKKISTDEQL